MNNIGKADRVARFVAAVPLTMCAVISPLPLTARLLAFALPALYLGATSLVGACALKALFSRSGRSATTAGRN